MRQLLYQRAVFWRQRAKLHWLKFGDSNSRLFHVYASSRKCKNKITRLLDSAGNWQTWNTGLPNMINSYFSDLFATRGNDDREVLCTVRRNISAEQNRFLLRPYTAVEVVKAVQAMHLDKSPGPNGFNLGFYQGYWEEVGSRVTEACLAFLNRKELPLGLNDTIIFLIPKVQKPTKITELRPISLCNVIVKIMTKMLANHMKLVLNSVI